MECEQLQPKSLYSLDKSVKETPPSPLIAAVSFWGLGRKNQKGIAGHDPTRLAFLHHLDLPLPGLCFFSFCWYQALATFEHAFPAPFFVDHSWPVWECRSFHTS